MNKTEFMHHLETRDIRISIARKLINSCGWDYDWAKEHLVNEETGEIDTTNELLVECYEAAFDAIYKALIK